MNSSRIFQDFASNGEVHPGDVSHSDYSDTQSVPELVSRHAALTPDLLAVVSGEQKLSYRELNQRSNQLAHYLQTLGVQRNVPVGLYIERSVDMVIGLLGILKAGGAYVPLDPMYPSERVSFMLKDACVPIVVTKQHLRQYLNAHTIQVLCLDADEELLSQQAIDEPVAFITGDDLAYIIYTSGSTGWPKGVAITHNNLLNLVFWHQRAFSVTAHDRATQVASPAFDATGWELWPYLTTGASVHLPDEETRITPALLRDWLVEQAITITFQPTALAESLIALEWPVQTSLRYLLTGADTLHRYPPARLPFTFVNNYGPTEATVVATSGPILPADQPERPPSIGQPIDNVRIYILDEQFQQVPMGTTGELFIGGKGVARGYLNHPDLTEERFLPDPFSDAPAARMYRTGDMARFLPDGQIAFVGRADYQIKLRGYRIEPNEIVAVLNEHAAIQASCVMAREDIVSEKQLVAYITLVPGMQVTAAALHSLLKTRLPDYMLPSTYVLLDTLPISANGKVDRTALPAPDASNSLRDDITALPTTPTEIRLAAIVAHLLHLAQVGIDENFFMLGGHSLLGTQLIAQIATTFGVSLSLRVLFNAPTVRELAAEIERTIFAKLQAMSDDEVQHLLQAESTI